MTTLYDTNTGHASHCAFAKTHGTALPPGAGSREPGGALMRTRHDDEGLPTSCHKRVFWRGLQGPLCVWVQSSDISVISTEFR